MSTSVRSGLKNLARLMAEVDDSKTLYDFLYGILTPRERSIVALRWELVQRLAKGETHRSIAEKLGISLCKTTRGSHELKHGRPGFRKVVKMAVEDRKKTKKKRKKRV